MKLSFMKGSGWGKRLIFYDLDGTLVDTREDISQAANHMRAQLGMGPLSREEICSYVGFGLRQLVQNCLQTEDAQRTEQGLSIYRSFYREHLLDHTALYPGVREVLDYFRGRLQAVVTNKPNPASRQILQALGVADYFMEILGGDDGYPKKPDPAGLRAILDRSKVEPHQALLVGDSPIDIQTGTRAGVATVVVAQGFSPREELVAAKPEEFVEDFPQLLKLARQRAW